MLSLGIKSKLWCRIAPAEFHSREIAEEDRSSESSQQDDSEEVLSGSME